MKSRRTIPYLICIMLTGLSGLFVHLSGQPRVNDSWTTTLGLPDSLEGYSVVIPRYCTNETCLASYDLAALADPQTCPQCGSGLLDRTLAEQTVLPRDTRMHKRLYRDRNDQAYFVTLVIGGVEKDSIHKPQVCLRAQGNQLLDQDTATVALPTGRRLKVTMIEFGRTPASGRSSVQGTYAYWFYRDGRETPYHTERTILTIADGALRNEWVPWIYLTVSCSTEAVRGKRRDQLTGFIRTFYPAFLASRPEQGEGDPQ